MHGEGEHGAVKCRVTATSSSYSQPKQLVSVRFGPVSVPVPQPRPTPPLIVTLRRVGQVFFRSVPTDRDSRSNFFSLEMLALSIASEPTTKMASSKLMPVPLSKSALFPNHCTGACHWQCCGKNDTAPSKRQ